MLNRVSVAPLYLQVKNQVINDISSGIYPVGSQIPAESELEHHYGVSRITIRRAITDLVKSGYLIKKQGKGTFVLNHKLRRNLLSLNSYTDFMLKNKEKPNRKIVSLEGGKANLNTADSLKVSEGDTVLRLARIMTFEPHNIGYEVTYYPAIRFPNLQNQITQESSVSQILVNQYGVKGEFNHKVLNMVNLSADVADLMLLDIGTPVYRLEKITSDENKVPIYYSIMYYDPQKFSFVIDD